MQKEDEKRSFLKRYWWVFIGAVGAVGLATALNFTSVDGWIEIIDYGNNTYDLGWNTTRPTVCSAGNYSYWTGTTFLCSPDTTGGGSNSSDGNNYTTSQAFEYSGNNVILQTARSGASNVSAFFTFQSSTGILLNNGVFYANATNCTSGQYSRYENNGWNCYNDASGGSGTVTSVALNSTTNAVSITGSPIVNAGTFVFEIRNATTLVDGLMTSVQATSLSLKALASNCVGYNSTHVNVTMNATTSGAQCVAVALNPGGSSFDPSGLYINITDLQNSNASVNVRIDTINNTKLNASGNASFDKNVSVAGNLTVYQNLTVTGETYLVGVDPSIRGDGVNPSINLSTSRGADLRYGTNYFRSGGAQLVMVIANAEKVRISAAGMGINTSGAANATLHVVGVATVVGNLSVSQNTTLSGTLNVPTICLNGNCASSWPAGTGNVSGGSINGSVNFVPIWNSTTTITNSSLYINALTGQVLTNNYGTEAAPAFSFQQNPDTGIYSDAAGQFMVTCDGVKCFQANLDGIQVQDGSATFPGIQSVNDDDTGIFYKSANVLAITAGGGEVVSFDSDKMTATKASCVGTSCYIGSNITTAAKSTTNNTVYTLIPELQITLLANRNYSIRCNFITYSAAATTGEQLRVNQTGTPTKVTWAFNSQVSATTRTPFQGTSTSSNAFADTGSGGTNVRDNTLLTGFIRTSGSNSVLTFEMKTEIAASSATYDTGSYCDYYWVG